MYIYACVLMYLYMLDYISNYIYFMKHKILKCLPCLDENCDI